MSAKHGFFRVVSGKIKKVARKRFTVKTHSAVIGIRGTVFDGFVKGKYEKIRCWSGAVYLKTSSGILNLAAGKMAVFQENRWSVTNISSSRKSFDSKNRGMGRKQKEELTHVQQTSVSKEVIDPDGNPNEGRTGTIHDPFVPDIPPADSDKPLWE